MQQADHELNGDTEDPGLGRDRVAGARSVPAGTPTRDRGSTFVEIVVTIALMALVVVPLLAAVRASIRASSVAESAAVVETLLVNAVDRVNRADVTDCDYSGVVAAAVETYGWPATAVTVRHEYLQDDGRWSEDQGAIACEHQTRLITITITHPEEGVTRELGVVKGDV